MHSIKYFFCSQEMLVGLYLMLQSLRLVILKLDVEFLIKINIINTRMEDNLSTAVGLTISILSVLVTLMMRRMEAVNIIIFSYIREIISFVSSVSGLVVMVERYLVEQMMAVFMFMTGKLMMKMSIKS